MVKVLKLSPTLPSDLISEAHLSLILLLRDHTRLADVVKDVGI